MKIFYFTATGNSLYVAKRIGGELYSIPKVLSGNQFTFEDEKIGIIFPVYGLASPEIINEFIKKVTLKSPYIFAIMTYGNADGDVTKWFGSFAQKNNINISYSNSLLMIDNYLPIFNIEKQKLKTKNIEENLEKLINDVSSNKHDTKATTLLGTVLRKSIKVVGSVVPFNKPTNFFLNDDCIKCRTCIKVCPRANVSLKEDKISFGNQCEYCLACVNNCPKKAIKIKRERNPNSRFRNENVTVKEIIESNNINSNL